MLFLLTCVVCIFCLLLCCIAIYCNLLLWKDHYYYFTYIHTNIHTCVIFNKCIQTILNNKIMTASTSEAISLNMISVTYYNIRSHVIYGQLKFKTNVMKTKMAIQMETFNRSLVNARASSQYKLINHYERQINI